MKKQILTFKRLYQYALWLLTRREHSAFELSRKLKNKIGPENIDWIDQILTLLQQKNFLDDKRFAESYIRMRIGRGYGSLRIRAELKERGVSDNLITIKNQDFDIQKVYQKKFGYQDTKNIALKDKARQIRYLHYKGFSFEEIKKVFKHDGEDNDRQ